MIPASRTQQQQVLLDAARGDERAASAIYRTYADGLYGYGLTHLRDDELAQELVQRVLEILWRRAGSFDPARGSLAAYVFAIAASTVGDLRRQALRRPLPAEPTDAVPSTVDDEAEHVLLAATVRAALDRLGQDHRRILELAYHRGLTQRQIAEALQLPLGTVKSRTYYALRAFRLACEELGVEP